MPQAKIETNVVLVFSWTVRGGKCILKSYKNLAHMTVDGLDGIGLRQQLSTPLFTDMFFPDLFRSRFH